MSLKLSIPDQKSSSKKKFKKRSILGSFGGGNFKSRGSIYTSFEDRYKQHKTSLVLKSPSISGTD